mgnify:FL=1
MSYIDIGFTVNLIRSDLLPAEGEVLDPLAFEQLAPEFSGGKLTGILSSQDGKVKINLDENFIVISDGTEERARLGKLPDGSYGILIKDKSGNKLFEFGSINLIQAPSGNLQMDFDEERILVKDVGGTPRVLIGKDTGGF